MTRKGGGWEERLYRKWKSPVHPANVKGTVTFEEVSQPAKGRLAGSSLGINYPALTFLPLTIPCRGIGTYLSRSQGAKEPNDFVCTGSLYWADSEWTVDLKSQTIKKEPNRRNPAHKPNSENHF